MHNASNTQTQNETMTTVSVHPIATRTQHNISFVELEAHVSSVRSIWTKGDKEGIFHCPLPKEWVRGQIVTLKANELYEAKVTFSARKGVNEEARVEVKVGANPDPVESADCILYSHELLGKDASSDAEFEIIAIRGLTDTPNPRPLNTLLHNIFQMSGGTPVEGTDAEKLAMIKESFLFWKDKMMAL
jgi:hypothetical protein